MCVKVDKKTKEVIGAKEEEEGVEETDKNIGQSFKRVFRACKEDSEVIWGL